MVRLALKPEEDSIGSPSYGCTTGHSDVLMGVTIMRDEKLAERLQFIQFGAQKTAHLTQARAAGIVATLTCYRLLYASCWCRPWPL